MNRNTAILAAILAIIAVIIGFLIFPTSPPDSNVPNVPIGNSAAAPQKPDACALFTQADAKQVLGPDAKEVESAGDDTMGKVNVTHCTYSSTIGTANILVRQAQTVGDAKYIFENSKKSFKGEAYPPTEGEQEYWVTDLGQYNVLKGKHWIIATVENNKEKSQQAAEIVASKL